MVRAASANSEDEMPAVSPPHPKFSRCENFDLSPQAGRGEARKRRRLANSYLAAISPRPAMPLYASGYRRGIVAAPHRAAAEAGRLILAEGGNALEAMVAMAAAIAAVYPHMNHIGGDGFFLIREPSGRIPCRRSPARP